MRLRYLSVAMVWLWGTAAAGQDAPVVPDLRPGHTIRIESRTAIGRIEGTFERFTPDSLIMSSYSNVPTAVAINELTALWSRDRATKTGAIVGGVIGAAGGAIAMWVLCAIGASDDGVVGNEGFNPACPAIGAGVGGLVGVGVGAGIGAMIPTWRLRFGKPR